MRAGMSLGARNDGEKVMAAAPLPQQRPEGWGRHDSYKVGTSCVYRRGYRSITLIVRSSGLYWYLVTRSSFCDSSLTTKARPPVILRVL